MPPVRTVALGGTVADRFSQHGLQGFAPSWPRGKSRPLSGAADDPRYFQISVPVQPAIAGGRLVDEHGANVIASCRLSWMRGRRGGEGGLPRM